VPGSKLAPFIGIGCPGIITKEGAIDRGARNLPGNGSSASFTCRPLFMSFFPGSARTIRPS
jgi:hypothetical protein